MADTTEIISLLNGIQSKIAIVESGSYNDVVLDEIKEESLKLLDILKLFLISERDTYYGYFLMNMVFEVDFKTKFIAGIRLNTYPPVFAYNPLIFCKFDIKECIYIVCHEIDHILLDHPTAMVNANPTGNPEIFKKFNLAADASVNDRLNHEIDSTTHGDFMAEPDGLITSAVLAKMFGLRNVKQMEHYAYYYELIRNKEEKQNSPQSNPDSMVDKKNQQGKNNSQQNQSQQDNKGKQDQKQCQSQNQNGQGNPDQQNVGVQGQQGNKDKLDQEQGQSQNQNGQGNPDQQNGGVQGQQGNKDKQDQEQNQSQNQSDQGDSDQQNNGDQGNNANGQSDSKPQNGSSQGKPSDGKTDNGSYGSIATAKSAGEFFDHEWNAGDDAEETRAVVRELINSAEQMMDKESRGNMPAHFASLVEKINTPPSLSWQQILKKYVGTIAANKRKTRTRLNRRQPLRFDLSGQMDDKVLKIVVAIDTSGSVDNMMIAQIFNEIFAILAKRKHDITVIECDAKVQRVYQAKTADDIKEKVLGRGGTKFTPVIQYLNDHKEFRDALLIYFTDGYGEREIPKPRTYRNIWAVIEDEKNLSLKEPYGIKVTVKL